MNAVIFAEGSVPVSVAARVYGKDASWVRAGIVAGWLPIGKATRAGKLITKIEDMDSRYGRINFYISPKLLFEQTASLGINDSTNPEVVRTFYDYISDRHFESTLSKVIAAEYHLNRNFVLGAFVTLNDFYELLGLSPTEHGANVGWYLDDGIYWIDFDHQLITLDDSPDGMEVCAIEPIVEPRLESEYDL